MQEDEKDTDGADILYQEKIQVEVASAQGAPVRELVMYNLMGYEPADEDTGEEADDGQKDLSRDKVKPVEQRTSEERKTFSST